MKREGEVDDFDVSGARHHCKFTRARTVCHTLEVGGWVGWQVEGVRVCATSAFAKHTWSSTSTAQSHHASTLGIECSNRKE